MFPYSVAPLEIKLEDYKTGSHKFKGSVKFLNPGRLDIDTTYVNPYLVCFSVNTKGIFGNVDNMYFGTLTIEYEYIGGKYQFEGPGLNGEPARFYAVRKGFIF